MKYVLIACGEVSSLWVGFLLVLLGRRPSHTTRTSGFMRLST